VINKNELVITRIFDALREQIWKAWTDPVRCMKWWGPKNFTAPIIKNDLRVGGKYLNCMRSAEGQEVWSTGIYKEIVPLEKIVCTDSFADENGNVVHASHYGIPGNDFPMEMEVTVKLEDLSGKTKMMLTHVGLPGGEMQEMTSVSWNESFDKLVESLK
jgi:uncharacterized protein YndB with AHSA1/START domain